MAGRSKDLMVGDSLLILRPKTREKIRKDSVRRKDFENHIFIFLDSAYSFVQHDILKWKIKIEIES